MKSLLGLCLLSTAASQYNETDALLHAQLATAAYCGYPKTSQSSLESWQCGPACEAIPGMTSVKQILTSDGNDAYAYVGKLGGRCVLAFRGTSDLAGWLQDLVSLDLVDLTGQGVKCSYQGSGCQVGDGFMSNYNSIASFIKGNLTAIGCNPGVGLTVTGHSLGAAEAAIGMYDLYNHGYNILQTYTFGQPRVGDKYFKMAFEKDIGSSKSYRLTHYHDPVPHLPGESIISPGNVGFVHPSTEVYYQEHMSKGFTVCDGSGEDAKCADSDTDIALMVAACLGGGNKCDHLTYLMAEKHTLMDGSSCTDAPANGVVV